MKKPLKSDVLRDISDDAASISRLAKDEKAFSAAYKAFRGADSKGFHTALERVDLARYCHIICEWIRIKECVFLCSELCEPPRTLEKPKLRDFAEVIVRVTSDDTILNRVAEAVERRDRKSFENIVREYKIGSLCYLFCHWICTVHYRLICRWICEPVDLRPNLANELRSAGEALKQFLEHKEAFDQAIAASDAGDAEKLGAVIRSIGLVRYCHWICEWFCSWRCAFVCLVVCHWRPPKLPRDQIKEAWEFARTIGQFAHNVTDLELVSSAIFSADSKAYESIIARLKLQRYCIQLCHWICVRRCRRFCILVCPPVFNNPWFTHVGDFGISADIASGTGLSNKSQNSHGGPDYAFFNCLSLRGLCPKYHPAYSAAPANQMAYRFLYQPSGATVPTPITGGFVCEVMVGTRYAFWNGAWTLQTIRIRGSGSTSPTPPVGPAGPNPPDHFIVPDPQGWVMIDLAALDDGFNGWLMGFASAVAFPGGYPAPGVLAGTPVPPGNIRNGTDAAIIFQATRVSTIPLVNSGGASDFSNQLPRIHINNWDEVNLLDLQQFINPGANACSPLSTDLDVLYTVDHELIADWHLGLSTASGMSLTMPPSGPDVLNPRGSAGTYHEDISSWPMCSYALTLSTTRRLTDGLKDDLGKVVQKTFCIGKRRM